MYEASWQQDKTDSQYIYTRPERPLKGGGKEITVILATRPNLGN